MFELLLSKTFALELKKLEKKERERIKEKLSATTKNPWLFWQRLSGSKFFRARVGKYRIISQINPSKKIIFLVSVKHRKKVYKKL